LSVRGSGSARVELRTLCLELLGWNAAVAAFLAVYVTRYGAPVEAVAAHLRVMLLPLLGLTLIRLAIARILPAEWARFAIAALAAWLIGALLSYYAVVLLGLEAWGRVISWDLIAGYAGQLPMLVDALGLSLSACVAGVVSAYLAMAALLWLYLRRHDWAGMLAPRVSLPVLGCMLGVAVLVLAIEIYRIATGAGGAIGEPIGLTLRPLEGARDLQGHAVDALRARALDAAEDEVRARYVPAGAAHRRNVVLIVVDALRPDHMGLFGYSRDTTPRLSALARNGTLRAAMELHAVCASSFCGLLGIASSRFVHQFSERPITLQEVLKRHGYRVHMLLSGDHTTYYGLKHIYGGVDTYFDGHDGRASRYVNDDGLLLDRLAAFPTWDGVPVMLQLHLMSAHPLGKRQASTAKYIPAASYLVQHGEPNERATNYYDNGVLQADATIAQALNSLTTKGYLQDALVVITADHGEALGEHGLFQHANSVREEVLRVPFVLLTYGAGAAALSKPHSASQVDIAPTLLRELAIPAPATWQGMALQAPTPRDFIPFQERWDIGVYDVRDRGSVWKYWLSSKAGEEFVFQLSRDPGEQFNVVSTVPSELRREWRRRVLADHTITSKRRVSQDIGVE
jgi:arylsulfatase A-like enzyme